MNNTPLNAVVIHDSGDNTGKNDIVMVNGVRVDVDHYLIERDVDSTVSVTLRLVGCSLNHEGMSNE